MPDQTAITAAGAEVLREGAASLAAAAERLGADFAATAGAIAAPASFTLVAGVGKSGYIGRKFAASLLSTGHGAAFIHPTDALHGDIGIAEHATLAVLLSHSGNTEELVALVPVIRQFGLASALISRDRAGRLGPLVDWVIETGVASEAGVGRLAPTTSSTTTLALCDALMMASLALRGFTPEQFRRYHPGGTIGHTLRRVADVMIPAARLPWLAPDDSVWDVLERVSAGHLGFAVVREGEPAAPARLAEVGIISDGDIRRAARDRAGFADRTAASLMTRAPKAIAADAFAVEALRMMEQHAITSLLCTDATGAVVGAVHIHSVAAPEVGLAPPAPR